MYCRQSLTAVVNKRFGLTQDNIAGGSPSAAHSDARAFSSTQCSRCRKNNGVNYRFRRSINYDVSAGRLNHASAMDGSRDIVSNVIL
jgi:hypothetical protein